MMGVRSKSRLPLWMQRLRSAEMLEQVVREKEHPLIKETRRECMKQLWDADGVKEILHRIRSGEITVREIYTETPSPMSLPLQWAQEAAVMYDYAPTPGGIHAAVEEALKQEKELQSPGKEELAKIQERTKLPEDEKQLHSLLMTEGDLAAGELVIPAEWLEKLADEGRVLYLEQGLWIAAEQEKEYRTALEILDETGERPVPEEALHIVRRMLRYRGAASVGQTALRYGWSEAYSSMILEELCDRKEAVLYDELYYHSMVFKRAGIRTVMNRRKEISTCPPEAYAALLLSRIRRNAPSEECLRETLSSLSGTAYAAPLWEEVILPARVARYRENLLDNILSMGEFFWHMPEEGKLCFKHSSRIDWDAPVGLALSLEPVSLSEAERFVAETLSKRGASFIQALNNAVPEGTAYDAVLSLAEKGIVNADNFLPVRLILNRKKIEKTTARQRVGARVKALYAGRFDLVRPLKEMTVPEQMDCCFDRYLILCRETAAVYGLSWQEALSVLRIQEYTGQVRRGYFVKDLSGAQFIRAKDFESITSFLLRTQKEMIWLNAADPMQPWGKILPHAQERNFVNVQGTAVAFRGGLPVAVFERQGKTLRVFSDEKLGEILRIFAEEYKAGRIFAGRKRIVVTDYPKEAEEALAGNGFMHEMQDYVLYR